MDWSLHGILPRRSECLMACILEAGMFLIARRWQAQNPCEVNRCALVVRPTSAFWGWVREKVRPVCPKTLEESTDWHTVYLVTEPADVATPETCLELGEDI